MDIEVKHIGKDFKEVTVVNDSCTLITGLLNEEEAKQLATALIRAALELLE